MFRYHKITQDELKEMKASQKFIGEKFENLSKIIEDLKYQNDHLKQENIQLKTEVTEMSKQIEKLHEDQDAQNLYSRRECLEFHSIPVHPAKN